MSGWGELDGREGKRGKASAENACIAKLSHPKTLSDCANQVSAIGNKNVSSSGLCVPEDTLKG